MTRSVWVGAWAFMLAIVHLTPLAREPGHPQELVAVLLSAAIWVAGWRVDPRVCFAALGAIGAALFCTKINVGSFFAAALVLAFAVQLRPGPSRSVGAWILIVLTGAVPLVLMRAHLGVAWGLELAAHQAAVLVGTGVVALTFGHDRALARRDWAAASAGFAVVAGLVLAGALASGSSVGALIEGLILAPARLPSQFSLHFKLSGFAWISAAASLLVALGLARRPVWGAGWIGLFAKGGFGLLGSFLWMGDAPNQLTILAPWTWLLLVPSPSPGAGPARVTFERTLLCLVATWQGLQIYPVAGTQVAIATLLTTAVFSLCGYEALVALSNTPQLRAWLRLLVLRVPNSASAALGVALLGVFALAWCDLPLWRARYAQLPSLALPGAHLLHIEPAQADEYRALVRYAQSSDALLSVPGLNSLHFWSGIPPPNDLNTTGSIILLSAPQQEQVVAALELATRPLVVVNLAGIHRWERDKPDEERPLLRFLRDDFKQVGAVGQFIILARRTAPPRQPPTPQ